MKKLNLGKIVTYGLTALPLLTLAQYTPPAGGETPPQIVSSYSDIITIINTAANWILGILLAAAVVLILIAAFNYVTAAGNDEKVKKAKSMITFAIIAVALGIFAKGIVALIITFSGANVQIPQG